MNNSLLLASIVASVCFFGWPLRMNQSGLSMTAAIFAYASLAMAVAILAVSSQSGVWDELRGVRLRIGFEAGLVNIIGVLAFTYMLSRATITDAPRYILIVITLQTAFTGIWAAFQTGGFDVRIAVGLATALATVFLMRR